jgi:peroxiredoxin
MIASKDMLVRSTIVLLALACSLYGEPGPAVGAKAPDFEAVDQNGQTRTLRSLTGRKGLMLVFYRSADW